MKAMVSGRWLVVIAVILVLTSAGVVWFWRSGPGTSGAPKASAAPEVSEASGPVLGEWTYVPTGNLSVKGAALNPDFIASDGTRFVAVGNTLSPTGDGYDLDSWTSTDGLTWQAGNLRSVTRGPGTYSYVSGLARWGGGFIVVGKRTSTGPLATFRDTVAWSSPDGRNWTPLPAPPPDPSGPLAIPRSVSDGPPLVSDGVNVYSQMGTSRWWTLSPGGAWRPVDVPALRNCRQASPAKTAQPGFFLYGSCPAGERGAVFTVDTAGAVSDMSRGLDKRVMELLAVAAHKRTMVAVGYRALAPSELPSLPSAPADDEGGEESGPALTAIYTWSTDGGVTWSPAHDLPGKQGDDSPQADRIIAVGSAFLAIGTVYVQQAGTTLPALWTSEDDGASWRFHRLRGFADDGRLGDAAELHGRIVIPARYGFGPTTTVGLFVNFKSTHAPTTPATTSTPGGSGQE